MKKSLMNQKHGSQRERQHHVGSADKPFTPKVVERKCGAGRSAFLCICSALLHFLTISLTTIHLKYTKQAQS
jgi:hypothetical protein